jgi:hypothetical protein
MAPNEFQTTVAGHRGALPASLRVASWWAVIIASLSACEASLADDFLDYDVVYPVVTGQHLSLLVEAWSKKEDERPTNHRSYFVRCALDSKKQPLIAGPVMKDSRSLQSQMPLEFDRELYGPMPQRRIYLSSKGELVRDELEGDSQLRRWVLELWPDGTSWSDKGLLERLHLWAPQQIGDKHFESNNGRYIVQSGNDNEASVFDVVMNRRIKDEWLEGVARDLFHEADLRFGSNILADDRKFVVVFPRAIADHTEFLVDGFSYPSESHGVIYERGTRKPRVFAGMRYHQPSNIPFYCFSDNGNLRFFQYSEKSLSVRDSDDNVLASHAFDAPVKWLKDYGVRVTQNSADSSLALTLVPLLRLNPEDEDTRDTVEVMIWRYKASQLTSYSLSANKWFDVTPKGFYPVNAISIAGNASAK